MAAPKLLSGSNDFDYYLQNLQYYCLNLQLYGVGSEYQQKSFVTLSRFGCKGGCGFGKIS